MRTTKILGVWAMIAGLLFWNGVLSLGVYKPFLGPEAGEMMAAFIAMAVLVTGIAASIAATFAALRTPLLTALHSE